MELDPAVCYRAVVSRDARHDGRFFTCVKTTGIYCRPICPARPPKLENCRFVPSAAAAQEAGFRPCLRCRPESSPNLDAWRGTEATVSRAMKLIEAGALDGSLGGGDIESLAARLEIGSRQLRRLFRQHLGAAPITVAQTRRVLLAKQLIHQTDLSMIQVALASGFGSVRRFNETFQRLYDRPPSQLRRRAAAASSAPEISLLLPFRSPYDWDAIVGFLAGRAIAGVEVVTPDRYRRAIELDDSTGTIDVTHDAQQASLRVVVRFPKLNLLPAIIARVRRVFDLSAEPAAIAADLSADPLLAPLVAGRPGLRVPGAWDGFEISVRAVLGQQITVVAARRLAGRLVATLGAPMDDPAESAGLTHVFPQPERFTRESLAGLGLTGVRAASLVGLAAATQADPQLFEPRGDLSGAVARLCELPGIGEWTAQYIAMRGLSESDAFLAADVGLQRHLAQRGRRPGANELLARAERWRPWRAYAMLHLWMTDSDAARTAANTATRPPQKLKSNRNKLSKQKKETYDAITA